MSPSNCEFIIGKLQKFKDSVDNESLMYAWSQPDLSDILDEIMQPMNDGDVSH